MALPDGWLDYVQSKLTVRYGARWLSMWEGVPLAAVRADWAEELDGLERNDGAALRYGLQYLPEDFPPTASAFRALCNRMPAGGPAALPAPTEVNHARLAELRAKVSEFTAAADVRAKEREARERATNPRRAVVVPPEKAWAPQGPLPWPRGVPRADA